AAEAAFGAHLPGHPGDLVGEGPQRVGHRVDGLRQRGDLALGLDRDLLRQVAPGDRHGHLGDVADLAGEVRGHDVHGVGEVLPGARHALDLCLPAEAPLGADLAGDPGDLVGEGAELVDHRVDRLLQLRDLAEGIDGDLLREVAVGHRGGHQGDVADLVGQVRGHEVDAVRQILPGARYALDPGLPSELALGPDLAGDPADLG